MPRMKVCLLYNAPTADASVADQDVLVQVAAVKAALSELGHEPWELHCGLDLESVQRELLQKRPARVFNLVESLGGVDRLMPLATMLLESMGLPFTGTGTAGLLAANHKIEAKRKLASHRLPTPAWLEADGSPGRPTVVSALQQVEPSSCGQSDLGAADNDGPMIVKAVWEHASWGMDDGAVVGSTAAAKQRIFERTGASGRPHFAEQFIEGREFNLSLLARGPGEAPDVLPAAEIDFSELAEGKPRIVGYAAKWDESSPEYHQTPRRFVDEAAEQALVAEMQRLARICWQVFDARGYARVDFRVDAAGKPWILELNANPCLSPDAGFAAALDRAEIPFVEAVRRILSDAGC